MIMTPIPGSYQSQVWTDYGTRLVPYTVIVRDQTVQYRGNIMWLRQNGPAVKNLRSVGGDKIGIGAYGVQYRITASPQTGPAGILP